MKRRLMVILLSLTLIFTLIPMTAFAEDYSHDGDIYEPFYAEGDNNFTINGSMTVENEDYAIYCMADGCTPSVKVKGNVKYDAGAANSGYAVAAQSFDKGKATVEIDGNLTAKAIGEIECISSDAGSSVKVGGDVSANSTESISNAIMLEGADSLETGGSIQIDGKVSVTGPMVIGIYDDARRSGTHKVSVGKDITATATGEGPQVAAGIIFNHSNGVSDIDVGGNITVNSSTAFAHGIALNEVSREETCGQANLAIHGNVISNFGILTAFGEKTCRGDIFVEGTIKAKDTAVAIQKKASDSSSEIFTKLTVWKANLNSRGNVAEIVSNGNLNERTAAADFEKNNIKYIVKFKQPSKGGKIYAVNSSGDALEKSHGYRVAKEGEKIILKSELDSGWRMTAAYNNGKALKKDDNGNFYLIVPKGGGILLSADLAAPGEDPTEMGNDGTAVGEDASAAAAEQKITGMKTDTDPKGSKFNKLRLRSTKQTKTSITLKWKSNKKAAKYVIYGNRCGTSTKIRKSVKLYTVKKSTKTTMTKVIKKVKGAAVKKNTYYKFLVVALNKKNKVVSTSRMIHVATKGGKYTNYKSVSVEKSVITKAKNLKKGKSLKLEPKQVKVTKSLKARKHVPIRYESSNKNIAKVTSKGVIKALKKGTCYVYIYAQNGVYKKVKVVVK